MTNKTGCPMPLDPPFETDDLQPWWRAGPPLRNTPRPAALRNMQSGNRSALDGIDDWIVPGEGTESSYPDDWFVPAQPSGPNSAPIVPNIQFGATPGNSLLQPVNRLNAPPLDFLASFLSHMLASRIGAMAWDPPTFPNAPGQAPSGNNATAVSANRFVARPPRGTTNPATTSNVLAGRQKLLLWAAGRVSPADHVGRFGNVSRQL
jgi:hypothetical protein